MSLEHVAEKLEDLARTAKALQLAANTTSVSLDHLSEACKTTRPTISLIVTSGREELLFVLHKEAMQTKDAGTIYRAAVFGGGLQSDEERALELAILQNPDSVDPQLKDEKGTYPQNAWYRLEGQHFLEHGSLKQMTYRMDVETIIKIMGKELDARLKMEAGRATTLLGTPTLLAALPMETPVLHRALPPFTQQIAERYGMSINNRGELENIGILVHEHFAWSEVADPKAFAAEAGGNALVWPADLLIANAVRDTTNEDTWRNRLQHQENDQALPIRNHSLLVGTATAVRRLLQGE